MSIARPNILSVESTFRYFLFKSAFLLEEPGADGNCYYNVTVDMVLTGQDLLSCRLKVYGTLLTRALAAADAVQNYARLACGLEKCRPCVN